MRVSAAMRRGAVTGCIALSGGLLLYEEYESSEVPSADRLTAAAASPGGQWKQLAPGLVATGGVGVDDDDAGGSDGGRVALVLLLALFAASVAAAAVASLRSRANGIYIIKYTGPFARKRPSV